MKYPKDGKPYLGVVRYCETRTPTIEEIPELECAIAECNKILTPATDNEIGIAIQSLFMHYRAVEELGNEILAKSWLDSLSEFPIWAIKQASTEYIEHHKWQPTISDIRTLLKRLTLSQTYFIQKMEAMIKKARVKAREDEEWLEKINTMKSSGEWDKIKSEWGVK